MTAPRPPPRTPTTPDDGCVPAAALTAFVLGEGDDAGRAPVARHLLGCAACRARHDAEAAVVARLTAFADLGEWEQDLAAADLEVAGARRRARRAVAAGAVAAAALVVAALGLPAVRRADAPPARASTARAAAETGSPTAAGSRTERSARTEGGAAAAGRGAGQGDVGPDPTARALLAAQASDGRWRSATGVEKHDVGATGLALLALLDGDGGAVGLEAGPVARAVADGVRWLTARADDPHAAGDRERAVAAAALQRVADATRDRAVAAAAERARRSVPTAVRPGPLPAPRQVLAYVR